MTTVQLEELTTKIDRAKQKKARVEGSMESIQKVWKKDFNVETLEEVEDMLENLDASIDKLKQEENKIEKELNALVDWENL